MKNTDCGLQTADYRSPRREMQTADQGKNAGKRVQSRVKCQLWWNNCKPFQANTWYLLRFEISSYHQFMCLWSPRLLLVLTYDVTSSSGEPLIRRIHVIKVGTHERTRLYATLNFSESALNFAILMCNRYPCVNPWRDLSPQLAPSY